MDLDKMGDFVLPSGGFCELYMPNGFVFFDCLGKTLGKPDLYLKHLIMHIVKINTCDLTMYDIDNLSYDDAASITENITPYITKINI